MDFLNQETRSASASANQRQMPNVISSLQTTTSFVDMSDADAPPDFDARLEQREARLRSQQRPTFRRRFGGNLPNTLLVISLISFLLGGVFFLGVLLFCIGGYGGLWFTTYRLGFYIAVWSGFHWGEFAVTAGWNTPKVHVDCKPQLSLSH